MSARTCNRTTLAAALLLATGAPAFAQQHGHHAPATTPHAGHAPVAAPRHAPTPPTPSGPAARQPPAGHGQHAAPTAAVDHAAMGHATPGKDDATHDPHAGHAEPAGRDHDAHRHGATQDAHGSDDAAHAHATTPASDPHAGHGRHAAPADAVDHAAMGHDMVATDEATRDPHAGHPAHTGHAHDHVAHVHPGRAAPQLPADAAPREPIPALTDADVAAAFPVLDHHAMTHASQTSTMLLFERLEAWDADAGTGQAWEASGWIGGDVHRLWLRSEGERSGGRTGSADLEVLYGRGVTPWWDVVVGARHEFQPDGRTWAAFGVQGLAPYFFEISATGYVGSGGQAQATLEAEYEVLLTNRLILQPVVEATFSRKDEPARRIGSGLNAVETGLRLRYEISRRFAPYVGVVHERHFGRTADHVEAAGGHVRDTRIVAGVRIWF